MTAQILTQSKLTKSQKFQSGWKTLPESAYGVPAKMRVNIRYDDECGNGHNSFSITADVLHNDGRSRRDPYIACGCLHDDIEKYFPEYAHLIKWHLCSSDGPMHYIANTTYWAQPVEPNIEAARSCAIWPDATLEQLQDKEALFERLPGLLLEFKAAIESLGFEY